MSMQRVLILCHDAKKIGSFIQSPSLKDVHFSIFQDWESSAAALRNENFSAIVAQKIFPNGDVSVFVSQVLLLAPKTPLILVLPENDGRSVVEAIKSGALEILFEENLGDSLAATLERYLFSNGSLLNRMPISELFDFCVPIITSTDMGLLTITILDKLREALGASLGIIFQEMKESEDPYCICCASGFANEEASKSFMRSFRESIIRQAASSQVVVIPIEKLEEDSPEGQWSFNANRFVLVLRFDLESEVNMYAVVGLHNKLNKDTICNLAFLYMQTHLALINSERSAHVQNLIYIDDLTKLHNIRYLNLVIDREIKRSERYQNIFSVLFMDIDYFKRVNDTHGHLVGSRVLQEVGAVLKSCVRDSDTVIRYGGDEFVVLLVDTNSKEGILIAERMRKAVENELLAQSIGIGLRLTVSIGIASFPEHATTKQHLLNLADQAMYFGKEATRNVVYLAQPQKFP
ncbi:MAG: GGDEF domain-containing protein [Syntrophorhabdaceae bacterium]|nr:GGDEF domain-containing protein [Syntrophorhabdaceae bacterium]